MKPTTNSTIEHRPARHDHRARRRHALPATDCFYRPDTSLATTRGRPTNPARRAYRRMIAKMTAAQNRADPLELIGLVIVAVIIAWPLIDLLIVLAQTADG